MSEPRCEYCDYDGPALDGFDLCTDINRCRRDLARRTTALKAQIEQLRAALASEQRRVNDWLTDRHRAAREAEGALACGESSGLHYAHLFYAKEAECATLKEELTQAREHAGRLQRLAWQLQASLRERVGGKTIGHLLDETCLAIYREVFPGHGE